MTNRDKILKMNEFDLLMKVNNVNRCVIDALGKKCEAYERCKQFDTCEKCIQTWLNEKE